MVDFKNIRKNTFRIGDFRVEPTRNLLKKDGRSYALEPKIMDVLCELASFPGEVIPRFDLIKRIWKVDYGADESLTRAISVLRKTFKKGGASDKYIETISKNGYRLIAPVGLWEEDGSRNIPRPVREPAQTLAAETVPAPLASPPQSKFSSRPPAGISYIQTATSKKPTKTHIIAPVLGVLALLVIAAPIGIGYFNAHTEAFETEIAELRDLSKVDPGALDKVDPITVDEPFRGDVSSTLVDFGQSVAVMPFRDMSADGTKGYFADGMVEEVSLELAEIDGLRIVGRSAAASARRQDNNMRRIGEALQVSHLIDGSVRTMNGRVRVSVQLIETASQTQLWGQSYDGALKDGLNLQARIAQDIISELQILLALNEGETLEFNLEGFGSALEVDSTLTLLPQ